MGNIGETLESIAQQGIDCVEMFVEGVDNFL